MIPSYSMYVMLAVALLLCFATIFRLRLIKVHPEKNYTELRQRIQSWWMMIALLFAAFLISKKASIIFFAFLSFLALKEFLSIVPLRQSDRCAVFWGYLSIPLQYYLVHIEWYGLFIVFIPVYMFIIIPLRLVLVGETDGFIRAAGILHWSIMLTVFCISHVAYLLVLPVKNQNAGAVGLVLFLLLLTEMNDIFQYIWGKTFGKRKIIPKVSPNKTWEGFLGGLLSVTICGLVFSPVLTPLSVWQGACAGAIIGCAGFLGDVVISSVKRDLKIKDSGTLIPGHGGILDRLDSLTFTSPLFFHYIYFLVY
jgi:phosphatidate cytidylyltransferase